MQLDDPPMTTYTAESKLRHPILLFKEMWQDLKGSGELAWRLTVRDISAQYRQTLLGYFWAVFPPLVASMVFVLLRSSSVMEIKGLNIPYPAYVMAGAVFWQLFVDALNFPLKVVTQSKAILTKINLPKEALVISAICQVLFSFFIKIILLVGVFIYYKVSIGWTIVLIPIPLLGLLLLGTMFGVLLIPVGLLYKDIQQALLVATSGLIFLTPVAYPPTVEGLLGDIMRINPITPLLMGAKDLLFKQIPTDIVPFMVVFGSTIILLFFGWVIYRVALPIIVERVGA
jgi:lipopolysaccharide transport system permease protein